MDYCAFPSGMRVKLSCLKKRDGCKVCWGFWALDREPSAGSRGSRLCCAQGWGWREGHPHGRPNGAHAQRRHFPASQQETGDSVPAFERGLQGLDWVQSRAPTLWEVRGQTSQLCSRGTASARDRMASHVGGLTQGYKSQAHGRNPCPARSGLCLLPLLCQDWFRTHDS